MRLIDCDVKRIVTLREQYSSLKVILLVNISLPHSNHRQRFRKTVTCFQFLTNLHAPWVFFVKFCLVGQKRQN